MRSNPVHINCDMGESYGRYTLVDDEALMPHINACNIACGYHAGDASIITNTIKLAIKHNLEIGAHPSYPDREGFGRRNMDISKKDLIPLLLYQVSVIKGITEAYGGRLSHVKPHGALYNTAAYNEDVASAIVEAVTIISKSLTIYTLPNSMLSKLAKQAGLAVRNESFIDRLYMNDLSLASRKLPNAVITDPKVAAEQAQLIWSKQEVITADNITKPLVTDTMCIHGDNPNALSILTTIRG